MGFNLDKWSAYIQINVMPLRTRNKLIGLFITSARKTGQVNRKKTFYYFRHFCSLKINIFLLKDFLQ